jgi:predicted AlkP superfamily pyrophosphatase or phosphodiesterase
MLWRTMPHTTLLLLRVACFLLLPVLTVTAVEKDQHVILISIDGFPAWLWRDETVVVPNLRKLAAEGASAKAMTVSNPSITWINHTTLITGVQPQKHGVLFNGLLTPQGPERPAKVEPWVEKAKLVHVPTLYDVAYAAGLKTAETDWVAITRPGTIHWNFSELPDKESPVVKELLAEGSMTPQQIEWMQPGPQRKNITYLDSKWTQAAIHIWKKHQPHLLLHHTLSTDAAHHAYGPASTGGYAALAYADKLVGDLVAAVNESGMREKTTIVISTDHGFKKVSQYVYPNVALKKAGYAMALGPTVTKCQAYAMTQGGMAFLYVDDEKQRARLLPQIKELLAKTEGIDRVIDGTDGPSLGMPSPQQHPGMGDLILYAKAGYAFHASAAGDAVTAPSTGYGGTHGYLSSDPELDGIFIANGPSIKKGLVVERVRNLDVAPTLARLLGLQLPDTDGRVLEEILR